MRDTVPPILEMGRVVRGPLAGRPEFGFNGAFAIDGPRGVHMFLIVSNGAGWEHASVQIVPPAGQNQRDPTWSEMCFVKDLIWNSEEWVVQYHPAMSVYVNCHPHVLHMWRPLTVGMPTPPAYLVGPK